MYKIRLLFLACMIAQILPAQTLSPTVVNASGGTAQNNANSLEWSLGELAISSISNSNVLLTQGFLQPYFAIVKTFAAVNDTEIRVFPNPAQDKLFLQTDMPNIATVRIFDLSGKLVQQCVFQPQLDLQNFDRGVYIFCLLNNQDQLLRFFKISKI